MAAILIGFVCLVVVALLLDFILTKTKQPADRCQWCSRKDDYHEPGCPVQKLQEERENV